jgi:hypothetical protein
MPLTLTAASLSSGETGGQPAAAGGNAPERKCCAGSRACFLRLHRRPVRPARTVHRPRRPLGRRRRAGHLRPRRRQDHRGRRRAGAIQRAAPDPHRQHPGAVVPGHGVALSPHRRRGPQAPAQLRRAPLGHCLSARHVRRLQLHRWPGHRHQRDRPLRPRVDVGRIHRQPARARRAVPSQLASAAWSADSQIAGPIRSRTGPASTSVTRLAEAGQCRGQFPAS